MRIAFAFLLASLLGACAPPLHVSMQAIPQSVDEIERFWLFTECLPMRAEVNYFAEDETILDLTAAQIQSLVEERLQAVGLLNETSYLFLHAHVNVGQQAFSIDVGFNKMVQDVLSGHIMNSNTWEEGEFGTHGGDAGFIVQGVSEYLDRFIERYLRVNEAFCEA